MTALNRAYDNAIVLREMIGSEALSYIQLAIYEMNRAVESKSPLIEFQKVIDNILAFWGIIDDSIDLESIRNIIKAGKGIERVDLFARLEMSRRDIAHEVNRMIPRIQKSEKTYDESKIESILEMLKADNLDYYSIVNAVDYIF